MESASQLSDPSFGTVEATMAITNKNEYLDESLSLSENGGDYSNKANKCKDSEKNIILQNNCNDSAVDSSQIKNVTLGLTPTEERHSLSKDNSLEPSPIAEISEQEVVKSDNQSYIFDNSKNYGIVKTTDETTDDQSNTNAVCDNINHTSQNDSLIEHSKEQDGRNLTPDGMQSEPQKVDMQREIEALKREKNDMQNTFNYHLRARNEYVRQLELQLSGLREQHGEYYTLIDQVQSFKTTREDLEQNLVQLKCELANLRAADDYHRLELKIISQERDALKCQVRELTSPSPSVNKDGREKGVFSSYRRRSSSMRKSLKERRFSLSSGEINLGDRILNVFHKNRRQWATEHSKAG